MRRHGVVRRGLGALALALALASPAGLVGQATLQEAAGRAREQWLAHNASGLLAGSDTVRLELPGVAASGILTPGQAARLLDRYLRMAREIAFEVQGVRPAGSQHGYAEARRRYAVEGTEDERQETVYLGFQVLAGAWRVREVRIVP